MTTQPIPPRPDVRPSVGLAPPPVAPTGIASLPSVTWRWWEALGAYAIAFVVGVFATWPIVQLLPTVDLATMIGSLVAALVIIAVLLFWLSRWHPGFDRQIGVRIPRGRELAGILGQGVLLYAVVVFVVGGILMLLFTALTRTPVRAPQQIPSGLPTLGTIATMFYGVVVAPIGEELFFRGILFRSIRDRQGFWPGALWSGLAFGTIHYVPGPGANALLLMSAMVCTGIGLAWIYERRGTLAASVLAHMTFNVIGLALIYSLR